MRGTTARPNAPQVGQVLLLFDFEPFDVNDLYVRRPLAGSAAKPRVPSRLAARLTARLFAQREASGTAIPAPESTRVFGVSLERGVSGLPARPDLPARQPARPSHPPAHVSADATLPRLAVGRPRPQIELSESVFPRVIVECVEYLREKGA
jgi:hypothetical protein